LAMDGQLTQVCCLAHSSTERVTLLEDLCRDVAALRDRVHHNVSAPTAVNRCVSVVTRKTPNKSRSTCVPIAA